ncbi:unnamed protein product [Closterium sp. NIES-53]
MVCRIVPPAFFVFRFYGSSTVALHYQHQQCYFSHSSSEWNCFFVSFYYGHILKMSADKVILQEKSDHSSRSGEVETDKEHMSTEGRGKSRSPVKRKSRVLSSLTRDDIVRLFDFPIETAARLVGLTADPVRGVDAVF